MATATQLISYREIVKQVLSPYADLHYANGDFQNQAVFDEHADRYLIMSAGFEKGRRYHGCVIDVAIRDGKIWLETDNTDFAIARQLVESGIPKSEIVLAFKTPDVRALTGYAVA